MRLKMMLVVLMVFSCKVFGQDFGVPKAEISKDLSDRESFLDWYFSVDIKDTKSFFELWYDQATEEDFKNFKTISDSYSSFIQSLDNNADDPSVILSDSPQIFSEVYFGKSRAPERDNVNFSDPRRVMISPTLSIGKIHSDPEIQIISELSTGTRRKKFLKLKDILPNTKPNLVIENQRACISCHQNGAENFSAFPWRDTNFSLDVTREIQKATQGLNIDDFLENLDFSDASSSDNIVRETSSKIQYRRICETLCKGNTDCQRALTAIGLIKNRASLKVMANQVSKTLKAFWPKHQFAQPSSVLPDFDYTDPSYPDGVVYLYQIKNEDQFLESVSANAELEEFLQLNNGSLGVNLPEIAANIRSYTTPFSLGFVEQTTIFSPHSFGTMGFSTVEVVGSPSIQKYASPLKKRPLIKHLTPESFVLGVIRDETNLFGQSCFGVKFSNPLNSISDSEVVDTVLDPFNFTDETLETWPLNISLIKETILNSKSADQNLDFLNNCSMGNSEDQKAFDSYLEKFMGNPDLIPPDEELTEVLNKNCSSCHGESQSSDPVLPLNNINEMSKYSSFYTAPNFGPQVPGMLECGEMPPRDSKKGASQLSPKDRAALVARLKTLENNK